MAFFKGDYTVLVFNTSGNQIDYLTMARIKSLQYVRVLNDFGQVSLTIDAGDNLANYKNTLDLIIEVYRRNIPQGQFEVEGTYLLRFYNQFTDDNTGQEYLILVGVGLEHLLDRRVVDYRDDPSGADGFSTKFGAADTVMRSYVVDQCVSPASDMNRVISGFSAAVVSGSGFTVFQRRSFDNLLDVMKEINAKTNMDFRVVRTSGASFEFQAATIGTNRSKQNNYPTGQYIVFNPTRSNIIDASVTVDRKEEKTFVYVRGQGIQDERFTFPVSEPLALNDSPWNRCETTTDARSIEDVNTDGLIAAGFDVLNDKAAKFEFTFKPDLNAPQGRMNSDWFLGDIVSAEYAGFFLDFRIKRISITVETDEDISIDVANVP